MPTQRLSPQRLIQQAERCRLQHEWDQAARLCFQVLALRPDQPDALRLLAEIYVQDELVEDMRGALGRLFDPADLSPHQLRRRLAFSYRVLSCWPGWLRAQTDETPVLDELEQAAQIISQAYVRGLDADLLQAWNLFVQAVERHPHRRRSIQWWMTRQYAEHGFFADAAEVLQEMRTDHPADNEAVYLLAEMRWWRDHADTIAWLHHPPDSQPPNPTL